MGLTNAAFGSSEYSSTCNLTENDFLQKLFSRILPKI